MINSITLVTPTSAPEKESTCSVPLLQWQNSETHLFQCVNDENFFGVINAKSFEDKNTKDEINCEIIEIYE